MDEHPLMTFFEGLLVIPGTLEQQPIVPDHKAWRFDSRLLAWTSDARNYFACYRDENFRLAYRDGVPAWPAVTYDECSLHEPRPYQREAMAQWHAHEGSGIFNLATGLGKTNMALWLMAEMKCATLIVAPVRDLMYQWQRDIKAAFGYTSGIIGDNHHIVKAVSCTTYKSAMIHMHKLGNQFHFIVFDECHHLPKGEIANAAHMSAAPYRLGLSATVTPAQERELKILIGSVVHRRGVKESIGTQLAEYEVIRVPVQLDDETREYYQALGKLISNYYLDRKAEDSRWSWSKIHKEARTNPVARNVVRAKRIRERIEERAPEKLRIVEDLLELHGSTPTIIFTKTNASAFDVSRRFLIPCILSHCLGPERAEILEGFKKGKYPAIVANEVLDEGVNVPDAKVAICLGGRKGSAQDIQRLGRVLRRSGDQKAIYYDVFCESTSEENKVKAKRKHDAYESSRHLRIR